MQAFSIASVSFFLLLDKRVKWEAINYALQVPTAFRVGFSIEQVFIERERDRGRMWV